ncbi:PP2C family serine/threonine-protein phosphatase [Methylibium sp.]|uniref:PP2C family serine/threonine-protein phosphatase n=1 Tax=Methylibium sp. TaxID=2067992 RepID=UPI003D0B3D49
MSQPATGSFGGWQVRSASVRGAAHLRDGLPNQDSAAVWPQEGQDALPMIVAIADGHGGARHFRSAVGAAIAVEVTVRALRELAPEIDAAAPQARAALVSNRLADRVVGAWSAAVAAHLLSHPVSADEWRAVEAREGNAARQSVEADPVVAYGATLLAAMVTAESLVLAQLGDGDILAVVPDGRTVRPVASDERLVGNLTTSLCLPTARADLRTSVVPAADVPFELLLLSTDGYANSFRSDADFLLVGRDFLEIVRAQGLAGLHDELEQILSHASENGSGDDITLGLLWRPGVAAGALPAAAASLTQSEASPAGDGDGRTPPRRPSSEASVLRQQLDALSSTARRRGWIALAAAAVAALALGVALRHRTPGDGSPPGSAAATAATTSNSRLGHAPGGAEPAAQNSPADHPASHAPRPTEHKRPPRTP